MQPIRSVVIVDDSPTMRAVVARHLQADGRFRVVGEAGDPYEARQVIKRTNPDVITLDVEMPRMNGLAFLEKIMRLRPMPVVMLSSLTQDGSREAVEALAMGAVDCIGKPAACGPEAFAGLAERVYVAAGAQLVQPGRAGPAAPAPGYEWDGRVVLIGASTGGVDALERVLAALPATCPPVLIAQHMPESFLASFAERLGQRLAARAELARDGAPLEAGRIYLAAGGDHHLGLRARAGRLVCAALHEPKCNGHRPSVDVLFRSALDVAERCIAVLLTGMGRDGAAGMAELRTAGAHTIAQDAATCVVYGMPRVAVEFGAAAEVLALDSIAPRLLAPMSDSAIAARREQ